MKILGYFLYMYVYFNTIKNHLKYMTLFLLFGHEVWTLGFTYAKWKVSVLKH